MVVVEPWLKSTYLLEKFNVVNLFWNGMCQQALKDNTSTRANIVSQQNNFHFYDLVQLSWHSVLLVSAWRSLNIIRNELLISFDQKCFDTLKLPFPWIFLLERLCIAWTELNKSQHQTDHLDLDLVQSIEKQLIEMLINPQGL